MDKRQIAGIKLGFEEKLWQTADKLRSNLDASEYRTVVLGLIFLKYISDVFMEAYEALSYFSFRGYVRGFCLNTEIQKISLLVIKFKLTILR